jgi:hypothetical protein
MIVSPQPATKATEIIKWLNDIFHSSDGSEGYFQRHRFKLNRYKTEIKALQDTSPETYFTLLGMIACIENDEEKMHRSHNKALICSGNSLWSLGQYALSLFRLGYYEKSCQYALMAHEKDETNLVLAGIIMDSAYYSGMNEIYQTFKTKLDKLNADYIDPDFFPEDDDSSLEIMLSVTEKMIDENPDLIIEPDPSFEKEIADLIAGVDLS